MYVKISKELKGFFQEEQNRLLLLLGIAIVIGICFRLFFLESKLLWADENCTLLRMSGYFEADFLKQLTFDTIVGPDALVKFQSPNEETGLMGTLKGLAIEEPQLSPLYFILLYKWISNFGESLSAIRLLATVFSILLFPALYWLCLELFQSVLIGFIAVGLVAVSPLHIVFAHEARPYSFWLLMFVLSNAALLRAMRLDTRLSWLLYTVTIPLSIYTYLLTLFTFLGHGVYVLWQARFRLNSLVVKYAISLLVGLVLSIPWLAVVAYNAISIPQLKGSHETIGIIGITKRLVFGGIRNLFFDLNNEKVPDLYILGTDPAPLISLLLVGLSLYCFYLLWLYAPRQASIFITCLAITSLIPLVLSGRYLPRYLFPTYLLVQIVIAFGVGYGLTQTLQARQRILWRGVLAALFTISIFASFISVQKETSWVKHGYRETQIARFINESPNPLVISDTNTCTLLMLSRYLAENVRLQVEPSCGICTGESASIQRPERIPTIPQGFDRVLLYAPSELLLKGLQSSYTIEPVENLAFGNSAIYLVR